MGIGLDPSDDASAGEGEPQRPSEFRTFLIADIRGYTRYTDTHGDEAAAALAGRFAALVREVVEARDGVLVELRGDEALNVFISARKALRAAVDLQERFRAENLQQGVGIGLDTGEAVAVEGGYRGTALNVAARLCAQAGPGETLASETVVRLAARIEGIRYTARRTLRLKGLQDPVRAVGIVQETATLPLQHRPGGRRQLVRDGRPTVLLGALISLTVVIVGAAVALGLQKPQPQASSSPTNEPGVARSSPTTVASASPSPSAAPLDVPMSRGLLSRANVMPGPGPAASPDPPTIRWQFKGEADMGQSPAVADDLVYVGDAAGILHVLDLASGTERWTYNAGAAIRTTPAVDEKTKTAYLTSADGVFHAIDLATHRQRWKAVGASPATTPTVLAGSVYVGLASGRFEALAAADGSEQWQASITGDGSMNAISGGVAYVTSAGTDRLYAIDLATGAIRWQASIGGKPVTSPATYGSMVIIVARGATGKGNRVIALEASTGKPAWSQPWAPPDDGSLNTLTVTERYVYTSSDSAGGTTLWAIDRSSGELDWPRQLRDGPIRPAIVGGDLYLAAGTDTGSGTVSALQASDGDGVDIWKVSIGGPPAGDPVVTGGLVIVATTRGPAELGSVWAIGSPLGPGASHAADAWRWVTDLKAGDDQPALYLDVVVDPKGNVYAADRFFNRVVIWDKAGKPQIWGRYGNEPGEFDFGGVTPGDASQSVAIAADGRIAVGDGGNHRVQIFDSARRFLRSVGQEGRLPGRFVNPCCVAFDPGGRLYVADPGRGDIQVFDKNGTFVRIIGSEGSGEGQFARLGKPYVDPNSGLLWVPDFANDRVEVVDPDGSFVAAYGTGAEGVSFDGVNGVVLDEAGRIFVVDDGNNNFVWVLDSAGKLVTRLGPRVRDHGTIQPAFIALTRDGKLYLPDTNASRIVVLQLLPPLWPPP